MPHATPKGVRGRRVKPDPDLYTVSETMGPPSVHHQDQARIGIEDQHNPPSDAYDPTESFYQHDRSDAPTPSVLPSEGEPMFREVRACPEMPPARESGDDTQPVDGSFFQTSFQDIGKRLKSYNDTLGRLQQLGVSHDDVQLPELVLIGDQSAGKSTLMSGLANLDLPRSEGTCTRCPLHIRVSRNSEWSCRVSLRKLYSYCPPDRTINEKDVTDQNPFFPWKKLATTNVYEFKVMHDKAEIEDVLRWAQIAILSDDKSHDLFVPGSGNIANSTPIAEAAKSTIAKFSPNVVALEIRGPDLPDLSFYDMPGIFQNSADIKDAYLVNVVQNLSKEYIQHPSAIIICALPMSNDPENSASFGLARRLGACERTIGVLTKADLLSQYPNTDNYYRWLSIMKGASHQTGLGYFITSRCPNVDLEEQKKREELLFCGTLGDWPEEFRGFKERCGVEKLLTSLVQRLGEEFAKSLPEIKQKVRKHLNDVNGQLAKLPELPNNVELQIRTSLQGFADDARDEVSQFVSSFNVLPKAFRDCLLHIKPKISLKDKTDIPVVNLLDDDSDDGSAPDSQMTTPSGKRRFSTAQVTPSKRPRTNGTGPDGSFNGTIKAEERSNATPLRGVPPKNHLAPPFSEFSDIGKGFRTIRQIREEVDKKGTAGMPGRIAERVYQDLAIAAKKPWKEPMEVFLSHTMQELKKSLDISLSTSFEQLKKRLVYREARRHLAKFIKEQEIETLKSLELLYEDETSRMLTFNEKLLQILEEEELGTLQHFRHHMRVTTAGMAPGRQHIPWEALREEQQAQERKRRDVETAKLGPDQFEREVGVVAYVRAYYRLSALRFADNVSQTLLCRLMPRIRRELPKYLEQKLGVYGPAAQSVYEKLMEEDDRTAAKRKSLKGESRKFEAALESIDQLETGNEQGDAPVLAHGYRMGGTLNGTHSQVTTHDLHDSLSDTTAGGMDGAEA